jgi:hypothetical protein
VEEPKARGYIGHQFDHGEIKKHFKIKGKETPKNEFQS